MFAIDVFITIIALHGQTIFMFGVQLNINLVIVDDAIRILVTALLHLLRVHTVASIRAGMFARITMASLSHLLFIFILIFQVLLV